MKLYNWTIRWFVSKPPSAIARLTRKDSAVTIRKPNNPSSTKPISSTPVTKDVPSKSRGYDIDGFDV